VIADSPELVAAQRLTWRGETIPARAALTRLLSLADERGEGLSYAVVRLHLCELELRAGAWNAAERLLEEWRESADLLAPCTYLRCGALLAAGRGAADEAVRRAQAALAEAEAPQARLEALRARGAAELLAHQPARAAVSLRTVWEHTRREGVDEPGAFPVAPDLVEALAEVGEPDQAGQVSDRLRVLSERQQHPWGLATAARCRAVVDLATGGDRDAAAAALVGAAADYERVGLRFDAARTLLSLGRVQRRSRQWGAARHALQRGAAIFDELGSPGWADQARAELARVGGRRPKRRDELTPSERRVVELAAAGRANKEIARALFVTVATVETHLSRAYAKLGVRRRTQLPHRLAGGRQ
jgi:DNA-binding CsgD family transcriptional regulator